MSLPKGCFSFLPFVTFLLFLKQTFLPSEPLWLVDDFRAGCCLLFSWSLSVRGRDVSRQAFEVKEYFLFGQRSWTETMWEGPWRSHNMPITLTFAINIELWHSPMEKRTGNLWRRVVSMVPGYSIFIESGCVTYDLVSVNTSLKGGLLPMPWAQATACAHSYAGGFWSHERLRSSMSGEFRPV